jgi:YidC/Oxa1 family membrane protein insertase
LIEPLIPMLVPMAWYDGIVGFFNTIMTPLYWVVSGLLVLFHSLWAPLFGTDNGWTWTLSIVCLTVVIRTALIPLFVKQIKSSRMMQVLQPKVRELQKKYGHDREKLGQETMKLYRENNANPLSSCLPLLLQMPIFLALFWVLNEASNGRALGYWLEINPDLVASLQNATIFGARISDTFMKAGFSGGINSIHIVTVFLILAMTATLFITQLQLMRKNMPPEALTGPFAQQQKLMLYLFPIIFAVGGINFPVGVLIYWFTSNLWTMGQQFYVIRRNPAPGTPAFDAWEARRKAKAAHQHRNDPPEVTAEPEPTGNGKASRNGSPGAPGTSGNGADSSGSTAPKVIRQQPRKQSRSQRKT